MRDDLRGAKAIAGHIGNCSPALVPELMAQGWPIIKVGREYRSTKTAIDLYLHRKEAATNKASDAAQLIALIKEMRGQLEQVMRLIQNEADLK
jgi:hypothetical protein